VQIGQDTHLYTEFFQPVDERGRYFVAPYARIGQTNRGVFIGEDRVAEYNVREGRVGLDAGAILGTWGEARLGAVWRQVETRLDTGSPVFPDVKETTSGPRAGLFVDQLDAAWFPRSGYRLIGSAYLADDSFGSDLNYKRLEGQAVAAKTWGPHTFNAGVAGGTDLDTDMPAYDSFTLGGPLRLSGYRINEFAGRRMQFGRLMYYNRAFPLPDVLGSGIYAGTSAEVGRMSDRVDGLPGSGTIWSGSVFLAADTFVGPLYFGIGAGEGGRWSLYLLLGAP
jgi:NTE family protein